MHQKPYPLPTQACYSSISPLHYLHLIFSLINKIYICKCYLVLISPTRYFFNSLLPLHQNSLFFLSLFGSSFLIFFKPIPIRLQSPNTAPKLLLPKSPITFTLLNLVAISLLPQQHLTKLFTTLSLIKFLATLSAIPHHLPFIPTWPLVLLSLHCCFLFFSLTSSLYNNFRVILNVSLLPNTSGILLALPSIHTQNLVPPLLPPCPNFYVLQLHINMFHCFYLASIPTPTLYSQQRFF